MLEKKCGKFGTIKYRMPNIPEAMILLSKIGINSKVLEDAQSLQDNELVFIAKLLENMEPFVTEVNIKIGEKNVSTYPELLNEFALMQYLSEIAADLFGSLQWNDKKKS